ncbi:MAG: peptidylprolyl isomerase [Porticoccaceae bacterium]|nr:peptidylprolyl isomerase [Porticoccaceae bacterium]
MTVKNNAVVSFHYTVRDEDGVQLDSSSGKAPLSYLHGANNIIPGLEEALEGKTTGDSLQVTIPPAQAYGEHMDQLVESVPRSAFGEVENLEVGMRFEAQTPQGPISVVVTSVEGDNVTVDGNHPLAGKTLSFDVTIDSVREATEEELAHGHVHGEGGHQH